LSAIGGELLERMLGIGAAEFERLRESGIV
jgi:hypothetical protein